MEKYIPDIYQQSVYSIDYQKLINRGIKFILFDLDNTLVPVNVKKPTKKIKELFKDLKNKDLEIAIFSNSNKNRLKPFKEELEVPCYHSSQKPFKKKMLALMTKMKYSQSEVAIIGDQLLTDILVGNKVGITTILINPISKKDFFATKIFSRPIERRIMKKLRKQDLFSKGRYYD